MHKWEIMNTKKQSKPGFFRRFFSIFTSKKPKPVIHVYFISGMCYNCKAFDMIKLPKRYKEYYHYQPTKIKIPQYSFLYY
jgi:hypothetical protein